MSDKRKISGRQTYVLDEDELKELEKHPVTGVIREVDKFLKEVETEVDEPAAMLKEAHGETNDKPASEHDDDGKQADDKDEDFSHLGYLIPDD